ncbi:MAG: DUF349 domain-containing protein [Prevotellaceae bacterium]|jgi:hypothetical protein|nr:DUF349 domain-containing protein [Prevotellaceae bacterium]
MENKEKHIPALEEQMNEGKSINNQEVNDITSTELSGETNSGEADKLKLGEKTALPAGEVTVEREESSEFIEEEASNADSYLKMQKPELLVELRNLVDNKPIEAIVKDVESLRNLFYTIHRAEIDALELRHAESDSETPFVSPEDPLEVEFRSIINRFKDLRDNYLSKLEANKEENYKLKLQVIEEIKNLTTEEENLNQTFRKFRDLQICWREIGQVPQAYIKTLWETYHHHVEIFYDYVKINKELRDLDLKKNLEAKEVLVLKTEALLESDMVVEAFRQLQKFHEEWREIGPVPHEFRESIWERFKEATSKINKKHQEYFDARKEEYQKNLEAKVTLCEKAEALAEFTSASPREWLQRSQELTDLMQTWKEVGFVPRKDSNKVYDRFKIARDKFFTSRREFYKSFKQDMQNNLQLKRELCEQAEALMNSEDWKRTTDELIALQRKWKEVGSVPRKNSDELWKRFRVACDVFFNRKTAHFSEVDSHYEENLKAKEALIEEINNFEPTNDSSVNFELLKVFQQRWNQIGYVPLKEKEKIYKKYQEAIDKQFKLLKISDGDKKVMKYRNKIENIQSSQSNKTDRVLRNEREKFFNKIMQLENDITLWENNIGFFAKSKNADAMIADVQCKIEQAREEVKILEEKIKLIDQQYE